MDVRKVAHLARLSLTEEEAERYGSQLEHILEHIEKLDELDIEGIEPTAHAMPLHDVMRDDVAHDACLDQEEVLGNAPAQAHDQIRMPKVVD